MKAEFVIVGAGMAGAATAYHLRKRGVRDVLILEKEPLPGQHSSGLNASMIREVVEDDVVQEFTTRGARAIRQGDLCPFRKCGSVLLGMGDDNVAVYFPLATGHGLWCPDDGVVETAALLETYLRGQRLLCNTELRSWRSDDRGVSIETNNGTIHARILVNAAGPWAGMVGDLPMKPLRRHLFQTPPIESIGREWPIVWDIKNGLYFRPENGGLLLCVCDERGAEPGDYRLDHNVRYDLAHAMNDLQPSLRDLPIKTYWAGQRTFCEDRRFVIGFDPRCESLFHVAGLGGHGVTSSYAVGHSAAELLTGTSKDHPNLCAPDRLFHETSDHMLVRSPG